jgi:hypothetical protein
MRLFKSENAQHCYERFGFIERSATSYGRRPPAKVTQSDRFLACATTDADPK